MTKAVVKVEKQQVTAKMTAEQLKKEYEKLGELFSNLEKQILATGKQICVILDNDEDARTNFRNLGIPPFVYARLERVGRGVLIPELIDIPCMEKLPIDEQKKIVSGKLPVVIEKPDGSFDTVMSDLLTVEPLFVSRVIAKDHIRTIAQQRQWLISKRKPITMEASIDLPWTFLGRKIELKGGVYTMPQIQTMMKSWKARFKKEE